MCTCLFSRSLTSCLVDYIKDNNDQVIKRYNATHLQKNCSGLVQFLILNLDLQFQDTFYTYVFTNNRLIQLM